MYAFALLDIAFRGFERLVLDLQRAPLKIENSTYNNRYI